MTELPARPSTDKVPSLITLVIISAISPVAINIFIPSMPGMADDFGVSYPTIQLGLSLYLFMTAALQLFIGPLSDQFGRRPVLLGGMTLFVLGTVLCLTATTVEWFLAGRVVQAASATGIALSRAIVRDLYGRERSASMIGYVTMGMAVAPMIAPAIGGMIDEWMGWQGSFWVLLVLGILTTALILYDLPETNRFLGSPLSRQLSSYGQLIRSQAFWLYAGTSSLATATFFCFLGGGPALADRLLGMSAQQYGFYFVFCAGGYIIGNFLSGRFSERIGIGPMVLAGAAVTMGGSVLLLALFEAGIINPWTLFLPMMVTGCGNGLCLPNSMAGAVSIRPEAAGAASGLLGAAQIGVGGVASVVGGIAVGTGQSAIPFAMAMAAFGVATLVFGWLVFRRETRLVGASVA